MDIFPYIATITWPAPQPQIDWVDRVQLLEAWLNANIGANMWCWHKDAIAFKQARHKTLFLLAW